MYIKKNVSGTESIVEIGGSAGSSTLSGLSDVTISSAAADQLLQYNGSEWVNVSIAEASAIMKEYQFTATSGQSTFSGSDDNSETLSYTAGAIQVFLNGIFLDSAVDYTATNGTSIVLSETVDANDYLQVVAFKKKIGDGNVSVDTFTGDNSTTAFTLSVDPGDENNTRVFVDGVYQSKSNYSVSGTTLTFSTAPPTDTAVEVEIGNRVVTLDTLSDLDLPDDVKLRLGTSQDVDFYHDGTDTYLRNQTGQLLIRGNDTKLQSYLGETYATFANNGAATLYYDNSVKFATTSSGITVTGTAAADGFTFDNYTLDSNKIATNQASGYNGDIFLDAANVVVLDAANAGVVQLKNNGSHFGSFFVSSDSLNIQSNISDADIVFKGNDGGTGITALTLDMSDVGTAHFNGHIRLGDNRTASFGAGYDIEITSDGTNGTIGAPNGNLTLDVAGDIILDADGRDVYFADGGTNYFQVYNDVSNNVILNSVIQDKDIKFTGNDGGSTVTALTLDMSAAGAATFNSTVTANAGLLIDTTVIDSYIIRQNTSDGSDNSQLSLAGGGADSDGRGARARLYGNEHSSKGGDVDISTGNIAGAQIDMYSTGNFTVDAAGDIILDAAGNDVILKDNGTTFGQLTNDSGNLIIYNSGSQMLKGLGVGSNAQFMGNVGIGASPATGAKLHLSSTAGAPIYIEDSDATSTFNITELSNNGANFGIQTRNSSGTFVSTDYQIVKNANGADYHRWFTAGTERMRITSTGRVIIGDSGAATSDAMFSVEADAAGRDYLRGVTNTGFNNASLGNLSDNSAYFTLYDDNEAQTFLHRADSEITYMSGKLGIGTSSPSVPLHVNSDTEYQIKIQSTASAGASMQLYSAGAYAYTVYQHPNAQFRVGAYGGTSFIIRDHGNTADRLTIINNGNVGIGTTNPSENLHVSSSSSTAVKITGDFPRLYFEDTAGSDLDAYIVNNANGLFFGKTNNPTGSNDIMALDLTNKRVGIGTSSPFAKSHIVDTSWSSGAPYGTVQLIEGNDVNDNNWGHLVVTDTSTANGNGGAISFATGASTALNPFSGIKGISEGTSYGGLGLFTRANGGTATERMRITSTGRVRINNNNSGWDALGTLLVKQASNNVGIGIVDQNSTNTFQIRNNGTYSEFYYNVNNPIVFSQSGGERMRIDSSGNLLVGLSSSLTNGKLQVAGSIGLSGNTQIRQATNSDGNTLQIFATQLVAGSLNSSSYNYTGGGLLASLSNLDGVVILDAGRQTSTGGRFKVVTTSSSNTSLYLEKNGTYTLYADTGSGNVGIGTDSPIYTAASRTTTTINGASSANLSFGIGGTGYANLYVDSSSVEFGSQTSANPVKFTIGGTEKMRIDSSGNLLAGKTSVGVGNTGVELRNDGLLAATRSGTNVGVFRRLSNDGTIIDFQRDSTTVGSIGTGDGNSVFIESPISNKVGLDFRSDILPRISGALDTGGNVNIGATAYTFGDIHLSGTSYTNQVELAEISTSISQTAYDIFVYDTRNDSDGGAWRYRTQHTSWYNETLNTSTRGSRREFPAVAVLVTTESGTLSIYDADDPDLPLWMSITPLNINQARVVALNGVILFGNRYAANAGFGGNGFIYYNFAGDYSRHGLSNGSNPSYIPEINSVPSGNMGTYWPKRPNSGARYYNLSDYSVLDVAITTLPNAPIDSRSGLPVPTMAVSHLDGLTVFKDDGNAYLLSGSNWADITYRVNFDKFGVLYFGQMAYAIIGCDVKGLHQSYTNMVDGRPSYRVGLDDYPFFQAHGENGNGWGASQPFALGSRDDFDLAQWSYYTHPDHRIVRTQMNHDLRDTYRGSSALMNYTGFDFNTGWMHGEIRGAYLSDTSTTAASSTATFTDDFSNSNNWSHADGSAITGGALVLANQSSSRATNLDWGGTTSKRYLLEVDVTSTNGGTCVLDDDGVGAGQGSATNYGTITGSGTYYNYFTKTGSARLRWLRTAGGPITINSMSIHEVEDDRSMSDRGLRAYGTITKSAVNTGTDLVGYSGFSSSNYLKGYPDVGSSMTEVSLYGWFKHTGNASTQEMVRVGNSSSTSHFISLGRVTSSADENWRFHYGGNGGSIAISDSDSSAANTWYFLMMTVSPTTIKCYVNAQLVDIRENTYSYLNTGSSPYIQLGNNVQVVTSDDFTASNVRFSESVPTDAQVDKMYNDEKHLYLTNAQATMNGGSGSIILEYDDQTKLLHAGTAAGRSVFQGLRRVEATTDAVTVMISASNGLVVEE